MANAIYPKFKQSLLTAGIDLESDTIKVMLVDTGLYTYSAAHDFLDDVIAGARVATSTALLSKTIVNGIFDAADLTITAVAGSTAEALVIFQDTGVEGTSQLIAYMDTGVTGLPLTPNGGDVNIVWNAAGIFQL